MEEEVFSKVVFSAATTATSTVEHPNRSGATKVGSSLDSPSCGATIGDALARSSSKEGQIAADQLLSEPLDGVDAVTLGYLTTRWTTNTHLVGQTTLIVASPATGHQNRSIRTLIEIPSIVARIGILCSYYYEEKNNQESQCTGMHAVVERHN